MGLTVVAVDVENVEEGARAEVECRDGVERLVGQTGEVTSYDSASEEGQAAGG